MHIIIFALFMVIKFTAIFNVSPTVVIPGGEVIVTMEIIADKHGFECYQLFPEDIPRCGGFAFISKETDEEIEIEFRPEDQIENKHLLSYTFQKIITIPENALYNTWLLDFMYVGANNPDSPPEKAKFIGCASSVDIYYKEYDCGVDERKHFFVVDSKYKYNMFLPIMSGE